MSARLFLILLTWSIGLAAAAAGCDGCGDQAARQPRPVTPDKSGQDRAAKSTERPQLAKARTTGPEGEVLAAFVKVATGTVEGLAHRSAGKPEALEGGLELRGGGFVATGEDGRATVAIREVGEAQLAPGSRLEVGWRSRCGVALVTGTLALRGSNRLRPNNPCGVVVPAGMVFATGAEAVIAVAPDGRTRIAAPVAAIAWHDRTGLVHEIPAGSSIELTADGKSSASTPAVLKPGAPPTDLFAGWLAGVRKTEAGHVEQARALLEVARGRLADLAAPVAALAAIETERRETDAERRQANKAKDEEGESRLTAQLGSIVERQAIAQRGITIEVGTVEALLDLVAVLEGSDAGLAAGLAEAVAALDGLVKKAPQLLSRPARESFALPIAPNKILKEGRNDQRGE